MKPEKLKLIEGKHTLETLSKLLGLSRGSTANLVSKLRKEGYLTSEGGGRVKKIYTIRTKQNVKLGKGMFDILNQYSKIKIFPPFTHKTYDGNYSVENAIVDLAEFNEIRILTGMLPLFNHVKDWKKLRELSKKKNLSNKIGMLYDAARGTIKTRKIPYNIKKALARDAKTTLKKPKTLKDIEKTWKIKVPFSEEDLNDSFR